MRTPIVAANWKMHLTVAEAEAYLKRLLKIMDRVDLVELVVFPPLTALHVAARLLAGSGVKFGAQNAHPEKRGAFTGEVAMVQVADLGASYVICGHSERRKLFGETDEFVGAKVRAAWAAGLVPILCVGEALEERQSGRAWGVVERQLHAALSVPTLGPVVIAYEPVWAIGTGVPARPEDAQDMAHRIRGWLRERFGPAAEGVRIQYGGSVTPENAKNFLSLPDIDGALVGGASLDPDKFWAIAQAARR